MPAFKHTTYRCVGTPVDLDEDPEIFVAVVLASSVVSAQRIARTASGNEDPSRVRWNIKAVDFTEHGVVMEAWVIGDPDQVLRIGTDRPARHVAAPLPEIVRLPGWRDKVRLHMHRLWTGV